MRTVHPRLSLPDRECVAFLQWALPRLELRWPGYRRVRRQVCKRLKRRLAELNLPDLAAYRARLEADPGEWRELAFRCRITISRFNRDRGVFRALGERVLPALAHRARAAGRDGLRVWSIGCASGEEVYSLLLAWRLGTGLARTGLGLRVVGTDIDRALLRRAREACYPPSSLREVPDEWRQQAFRRQGEALCLRQPFRAGAEFRLQDVREEAPQGPFDLILCRNLVLTYFQAPVQREVIGRILPVLREEGALVLGAHEALPAGVEALVPWPETACVHRKVSR